MGLTADPRWRWTAGALLLAALGCDGASVVGGPSDAGPLVAPTDAPAVVAPTDAPAVVAPDDVATAPTADVPAPACAPAAAEPTAAMVARLKNLLTGELPTAAEVARVAADPAALDALVVEWMARPTYREKLLRFFVGAFQQDQFTTEGLIIQFEQYFMFEAEWSRFVENLQESFARTALAIVDEGRPFTDTMTTTRFMLTPALMAAYAVLDNLDLADDFASADRFQVDHPSRVVVQSARPIPLAHSLDPAHPDYMTFYSSLLAAPARPGCPSGEIVYPAPAPYLSVAMVLFNQRVRFPMELDCRTMALGERVTVDADFDDWRMVTLRAPRAGELPTPFYALPTLRAARELVVTIPRVSFFSTPAFFARWPTNSSNLARVQINQTLIVALGRAFDLSNATTPAALDALDADHAAPGSACYGCHVTLDPMRQYFRRAFSVYGGTQRDARLRAVPAEFAFQGQSGSGPGLLDLGQRLAAHPLFAAAWTQRLCAYANSAPCDESDPEFARVTAAFRDSHHDWNTLVRALFSSRLVTHVGAPAAPRPVPIARREHLCALLSTRLGVDDVCGQRATTRSADARIRAIAASWPSGQISRGQLSPAFAVVPTITARGGIENLCAALAERLVDADDRSPFHGAEADAAVTAIVDRLHGPADARGAAVAAILREHVRDAVAMGETPTVALRSAFVLACTSSPVVAVGL